MRRFLLVAAFLAGVSLAQAADPQAAKNIGPRLAEALKQTPAEFMQRYDANKDGVLTPDEVPPFLKKTFDRADTNGDGKLDEQEVTALLRQLRKRFAEMQASKGDSARAGAVRAGIAQAGKKLGPRLVEALTQTPGEFMQRYDANKDGVLSRDEVPPFLKAMFDRVDTNGDGKLDEQEVTALLRRLRERFAGAQNDKAARPAASAAPQAAKNIGPLMAEALKQTPAEFMQRYDANKDGVLTPDEVPPFLKAAFDRVDTNGDGKLDEMEVTVMLRRLRERFAGAQVAQGGKPAAGKRPAAQRPQPSAPDFDALDLNADGRLTPDELKGTPLADKFGEIDANKDGKIDRKEFTAYFEKQADKK